MQEAAAGIGECGVAGGGGWRSPVAREGAGHMLSVGVGGGGGKAEEVAAVLTVHLTAGFQRSAVAFPGVGYLQAKPPPS